MVVLLVNDWLDNDDTGAGLLCVSEREPTFVMTADLYP